MDERTGGLTPLEDEAHAWIRRLVSGEATAADAEALRQWCGLSPAHATAFSVASQFWDAFGAAGQSLMPGKKAAIAPRRISQDNRPMGRRVFLGGLLAASAAGFMIVRPPLDLWPSLPELNADYRTGIGEQRKVIMGDGVAVQMNSRTSISIGSGKEAGIFNLIAGEASFRTQQPRSEPFSVLAAGGRVSALNARFDVRLRGSGACVTCLAEQVHVRYQGQIITLGAGQRVTYGGEGLENIVAINPAEVTAWQDGLMIFNMTPLSDVIEELNRYRSGRIILLKRDIAHAPVNGRFRIDRPNEALAQIERAFDVRGRLLPGGIVLLG